MSINLLQETLGILKQHNKSAEDVLFCNISKYDDKYYYSEPGRVIQETNSFSFEDFTKIADFEYNSGFGSIEVNLSLEVVGKDFWLERHEYDGSENWEFKNLPNRFSEQTPETLKRPDIRY